MTQENAIQAPLTEMASPEAVMDVVNTIGEKVINEIRTVFDPEIPVNVYDLGLIYAVDIKPTDGGKADVAITMTLTTPNCPVAGQMPAMVQQAVQRVPDVGDVQVELVWSPPWDNSRMTDEARLQLNMF
ncbi:MAG: DUF59 domain-containing protein [Alphaproteobacteria bacterium]|nr:DUF59 domain-containing protein [Alphaproteobacteria bacterium]MBV8548958.1 DUF59 domain-containing protein [Alphaproteobacteria bacterium]